MPRDREMAIYLRSQSTGKGNSPQITQLPAQQLVTSEAQKMLVSADNNLKLVLVPSTCLLSPTRHFHSPQIQVVVPKMEQDKTTWSIDLMEQQHKSSDWVISQNL